VSEILSPPTHRELRCHYFFQFNPTNANPKWVFHQVLYNSFSESLSTLI